MGGKVWWWALLFVFLSALWSMVPSIPGPTARDFADFVSSDRGEAFFRGAWGWYAVVVVFAIFNTVLGEELLFRGVLLPRMKGVFGRRDWIANGVLFGVYHLHQPWSMPSAVIEGIFFEAYPSRRFQSAWMGIIVHSIESVFFLIFVLTLVLKSSRTLASRCNSTHLAQLLAAWLGARRPTPAPSNPHSERCRFRTGRTKPPLVRRGERLLELVPAQCYERVVRLNVPAGHGAGFTVNRHGRQWLVTAAHVVRDLEAHDIEVVRRDGPISVSLTAVPATQSGAERSRCSCSRTRSRQISALFASSDGAVFSQDAYFLGFPYGLGLQTSGISYPFVKKAIVSAFERDLNGVTLWFLDGINNPGFSGGPVVFNRSGTKDWHVAAVVSGYRTERVAVVGGVGEVSTNTGIIVAYDISHAVDSIDAFQGN